MKAVWEVKNLGDVCHLIGGGTPSKDNADFYTGNIPWATVRDMRSDVITDTEYKITESAIKNSSTNIIPSGSVIIATRVGLGKVCLLNQDTAINQDLRGIFPKDEEKLSTRFLFWWLKSVAHLIVAEGTGATVQGVKLPFVKSLQIPLPPLPEQQRIVAILDETFEAIAAARTNTEQNRQNARALFESYLQSVFSQRGDGWVERKLGDQTLLRMIDGDRGTNYPKATDFLDHGPCLFLNTKNVRPNGFEFDSTMFISAEKDAQLRKGKLQRNDVVMSEEVPFDSVRINSGMLIFRANQTEILPAYLFEILRSGIVKEQINKYTTGAAQPQLPIKTLVNFSIPVPTTLAGQSELVKRIREFEPETQRLESLYQRKMAALDELKQSLLQQAFSGQL